MNTKPALLKALFTGVILTSSAIASAQTPALKVAVVKGVLGSQNIVAGDIETGIKRLSRQNSTETAFDKAMGLCVAYLKSDNTIKSESACTAAVEASKLIQSESSNALYLKSLSYSNRAVAKYLNDDIDGAVSDLTLAKSLSVNNVTTGNLAFIQSVNAKVELDEYTETFTD